jgi:retron-type reverse transcriptase
MSTQVERAGKEQGEALLRPTSDEAQRPRHEAEDTGAGLLKAVLARDNMQQAWKRVRANKGAAGIDGLSIDETAERLMWEWPLIREQLLQGKRPSNTPVSGKVFVMNSGHECGCWGVGWSS